MIEQIPGNSTLKKHNQILITVNILQGLILQIDKFWETSENGHSIWLAKYFYFVCFWCIRLYMRAFHWDIGINC